MNYKPNNKLKLEELKIKSFSTELENSEKVLGGSPQPQLAPLMVLQDNANISHYGLVMTGTIVATRKVKDVIRSNG